MNVFNQSAPNTEAYQAFSTSACVSNVIPFPSSSFKETTNKSTPKEKKKENHTVHPLTDIEDVRAANQYFLSQPQRYQNNHLNIRNYMLFVFGCNSARRIGDILKLKINNILNSDLSFKPHLIIVEGKTGKDAEVLINDVMKNAFTIYLNSLDSYSLDDYLFKSREGGNYPITACQAWRIYKNMSKAIGLDKKGINVGTHSARKTWAYHTLNADPTNPEQIVYISEALNHRDISTTRKYCGITQEKMDAIYSKGIY